MILTQTTLMAAMLRLPTEEGKLMMGQSRQKTDGGRGSGMLEKEE
jgi:hypothetical protein